MCKKIVWVVAILLVLVILVGIVGNLTLKTKEKQLSQVDQKMMTDLEKLNQSLAEKPLWPDFKLNEYPLLLINKSNIIKTYYAANFEKTNSIGAKAIDLGDEKETKISRYSPLYPSILPMNFSLGNFSTTDSTKAIDKNEPVFYFKYDKNNFATQPPGNQFIIILTHEAFHFYQQKNWADGQPDSHQLAQDDLALLGLSYKILDELNQPILAENKILALLQDYLTVSNERQKLNKSYVAEESKKEVIEGTASYAGREAGKRIDKDYKILEFENGGQPTFYEVFETMSRGDFGTDFIVDFGLYNSGNVLANSLDKIEETTWKEKLNQQTKENVVSFVDVIELYLQKYPTDSAKNLKQIKEKYQFEIINQQAKNLKSQLK